LISAPTSRVAVPRPRRGFPESFRREAAHVRREIQPEAPPALCYLLRLPGRPAQQPREHLLELALGVL
jgi:hypothetical protein